MPPHDLVRRRAALMSDAAISPSVHRVVAEYIESVGQLELLLLLRRTREREWDPDEASRQLRTSVQLAQAALDRLARHGLAKRTSGGYTYAATGQLDTDIAQLDRVFATHRTRVISLIFA